MTVTDLYLLHQVLPLEEEIKALKDKLRYTDEQLRVYESNQVKKTYFVNYYNRHFSNHVTRLSWPVARNCWLKLQKMHHWNPP